MRTHFPQAKDPAAMEAARGLRADVAQDPRLTITGCVCDETGLLTLSAYKNLIEFQEVTTEEKLSKRPGVFPWEVPDGVRPWRDAWSGKCNKQGTPMIGEGWIALRPQGCGKSDQRWFNRCTWGSWRLCFLLARL